MSTKVIEEIRFCKKCNKETLQRKNSKQMSWLMHLFLTVITLGVWLAIWVVLLIFHALNKTATAAVSSWVCSVCGEKN